MLILVLKIIAILFVYVVIGLILVIPVLRKHTLPVWKKALAIISWPVLYIVGLFTKDEGEQ